MNVDVIDIRTFRSDSSGQVTRSIRGESAPSGAVAALRAFHAGLLGGVTRRLVGREAS